MKQRIYRYIAIALAVAALLVAVIEVLIYGFPLFAFFFVAGAKDFYDSSIGRVYDSARQHGFGAQDPARISYPTSNHFDSIASDPISHTSAASSFAHGENTFDRGSINNFD